MIVQYISANIVLYNHQKENESIHVNAYNTKQNRNVHCFHNSVATVATPPSLSALISGIAENACIAIAHNIPATTRYRSIHA